MTEWSAKNGRKSIPLVVAHTHAHGDHHQGDAEFAGRPDTVVVGLTPKDVADFFKITDWPNQIVPFDLGGRVLHIIPTPGHEPSHIMVFDEKTRILQGGDAFGPCRLLFSVNNFKAFRDSTDRVVAFTAGRNVSHILGNHIEMTGTPGNVYPMRAPSHPDEPLLELKFSDLLDLQKALHAQGDRPVMEPHDRFMIYPLTFAPPAPPAQ
jgi:glyoxylase-like metal-dependent hydrolase (beta-lactamase superfamily II)